MRLQNLCSPRKRLSKEKKSLAANKIKCCLPNPLWFEEESQCSLLLVHSMYFLVQFPKIRNAASEASPD